MRKWLALLVLAVLVALAGCSEKAQVNETANEVKENVTEWRYLDNITIVNHPNNTSTVILRYKFPHSGFDVSLKDVKINGSVMIVYTEVNETSEVAPQVITYRNLTLNVNGTVETVLVFTEAPVRLMNETDACETC